MEYEPLDVSPIDPDSEEGRAKLFKKAFNYTIRLLAKKDYSVFKMKQKLRDKGYDSETSKEVIDKLLDKNYLREDLYIEARIKGFIRKGHAANVILYRLSQEQCHTTQEYIEEIMNSLGLDPDLLLREVIEKKLRLDGDFVKNKQKLREKVFRYCLTRGYSISDVSRLYNEIYSEQYPEDS